MRILLCNDDGILAPGLLALYNVLAEDAEVEVVAPSTVQSATAHSITVRHPVLCQRIHVAGRFHGMSVEGSPADCVKLAVHTLLEQKPDVVVSGINAGENVGVHVLYSGTVAAAAEGAMLGFPAIAVSLEFADEMDFDRAAGVAKGVIDCIVGNGLRPGRLYNVNIPALRPGWPRGVRVASQSTRALREHFERRNSPGGREYFWLAGGFKGVEGEPGSDLEAVRQGYVAVTPLQYDLTQRSQMDELRGWPWPGME